MHFYKILLPIVSIIVAKSLLFAVDINTTNPITNPIINTTTNYNLANPTLDQNKSNWNTKDWHKKLTDDSQGGAVGNTMLFMNKSPFLKRNAETTDTSKLTVEAINNDTNLSSTRASSGYSESFRSQLTGQAQSNPAYRANSNTYENTLECFIARDLPYRYKCEETGLVYGGDTLARTATGGSITNMDGMSGKQALNLCKENCKQQFSCINVNTGANQSQNISSEQFVLTNSEYIKNISTTTATSKITNILFDLNITSPDTNISNETLKLDVSYIDDKGKTIELVKNFKAGKIATEQTLAINNLVQSLKFRFFTNSTSSIAVKINSMKINYESGNKYICPQTQDISVLHNEDFAYICPAGSTVWFGEHQICTTGVLAGDNSDGTYSNEQTCRNICNIPKKCVVETGNFDADIFSMAREGRLGRVAADGEFTSADNNLIRQDSDCTTARQTKQQIVNEVIYDAKGNPIQTVLNGSLVPGVDRPRVLNDAGVNEQDRNKQEWKDSAYQNMLNLGTYAQSDTDIGGNTSSKFAYYINLINGADYGNTIQTSSKELYWKLKPASLMYDNSLEYKLFIIVKADIEKYAEGVGSRNITRDQVWYIKTSESDTFYPFYRIENYATVTAGTTSSGTLMPTVIPNPSAQPLFSTFSGGGWGSISSSMSAPSFKNTVFAPDNFWYEFKAVGSVGNIHYNLPGLIRSVTANNTNIYTGDFTGTGNGVANIEVYGLFSENQLSYQQIKDKITQIDNLPSGTFQADNYSAKIYKTTMDSYFNKFIKGDNVNTNSNVEIYQYGNAQKNSLKAVIKPRREDIGKNGFVYIFVY